MQSLEEKLTTKWYRDYSHKLHIQRLQEIKTHASKRIDNSEPRTKDSIIPQKHGKEFLKKEKKKSITKNNQQLLKILTEITAGKRETTTQKILNSTKDAPTMKSLNITVRKKEARRIDEDNEDLVRRLNDKKPGLSFKKLQEEWSIMNKYRESISKRGYRNGSSNMTSRLPPMDESQERPKPEVIKEENLSKTLNSINLPKIKKKVKGFSVKPLKTHEEEQDLNESKEEKVPENKKDKERRNTEKNIKESQEDVKEHTSPKEETEKKHEKIEVVEIVVEKHEELNNKEDSIEVNGELKESEKGGDKDQEELEGGKNEDKVEEKIQSGENKDKKESEKSEEYSEDNEEFKDEGVSGAVEVRNSEPEKIENDEKKEVVESHFQDSEVPLDESKDLNLAEKTPPVQSNPRTPDALISTENPIIPPPKEENLPDTNPHPDSPKAVIPEDYQDLPPELPVKQSSNHSSSPNLNDHDPEIGPSDPIPDPNPDLQDPPIE